ncbi:MAG: co-chaperone GroES [Chlamydiales bacterium]|nr:co-chaperone GroES [Chlamydiales bacterium]
MAQKTVTKIRPVGSRVVAKRLEEEAMQGGIIVPDSAKKKQETVEVVAVGAGKTKDGKEEVIPVKVGDKIMIDKYAGQEVTIDDEEYVIVRSDDIIAIIEE